MSRMWQLRSIDRVLSQQGVSSSERLYERFKIDCEHFFQVRFRDQWYPVESLAYGGMAFRVPQSEREKLLPGNRVHGVIKLWDSECPFTARAVGLREDGEHVVAATQFAFDSIALMDFLRLCIPYMRMGYFLAQQPSEQVSDSIEFDLTGLERIDFDAELAVSRNPTGVNASVVFAYGNAQIALAYSHGRFSTYKNLSFGGEIAPFSKTAAIDHAIFRKGALLFTGFLSVLEGDADVRFVLEKALEDLAKPDGTSSTLKRTS